jgi:predicted PolB exonuclease-like 3'-5' exonuclease
MAPELKEQLLEQGMNGVSDSLALHPGLVKVVAWGLWLVQEDRGKASVAGEGDDPLEEVSMLADLWTRLTRTPRDRQRVITFNGRAFDGPVLAIRSAQLGLRPTVNLMGYRYDVSEHCDLSDILNFQGATRGYYPLSYWCSCFGIESPKMGLTGAEVGEYWEQGKYDEIREYVLGDCKATAELYRKLRPGVLPFFKGA